MKYKLLPFFLFFSLILFSQENCTNGIDDDGDGLIDLNDQECLCNNSSIPSIIPNPSFEVKTSCPTSFSQLSLATPWIQATTGTSDFFHNCGYVFPGMAALGINNFPDGNGAAGVIFCNNYKEYLGVPLTTPMVAGTSYQLTMNVVALKQNYEVASAVNSTTLEPANITVYGCSLGTNLPVETILSPNTVDPTWIEIGHASYSPVSTWGQITITFTPSININAIMIGAPPVLPPSYPSFTNLNTPYFVFDNLLLNTSSSFGVTITSVGTYCDNNLVLSAEITAPLGPGTTYQWYKNGIAIVGATNSTYNVLGNPTSLGSYSVQIINGTNCYVSSNYIINNSIPSPSYTKVDPNCTVSTGSITITTPAFQYSFDNGVTWQSSPTKDLLPLGIYLIKTKSLGGCISSTTGVAITQPPLLVISNVTVVHPTTCNGLGAITVNSLIASEYSFDNGVTWQTNPTKDLLPPGIYYIKIKTSSGCISSTVEVSITQPQLIGDSNLTVIQPTCNVAFGTITVNSPIATEYSFDNGITWQSSPTKDLLPPGIYYIKIKTSTGCISSTVEVRIEQQQLIGESNLTVIQPTCNEAFGTITVNSPIATEYSFDDGITWQISPTKDLLTPGVYYIKIKTLDGCESVPVEVFINEEPQSLGNPEYTVIQPGCGTTGSITITTLASQYSFDNGATFGTSNTLNNLIVGTYLIKFKDASGCISGSSSVTILAAPIIPSAPTVTVAQPANCTASTGTITVTSNALLYSFDNGLTWSNNSTSGQLTPGTYFIKIKNNFSGCPSLSTTAIINAPTGFLLAPSFTIVQPDCTTSTGTITITTLANQYSFDNGLTWSTNPTSLSLNPGNYLLKIKDNTGCESNSSVAVVSPFTNPTPTFNTIPAFCAGTTSPVLPTTSLNGIVGTWLPATVSNTTSGTYIFTPNAGQCGTITTISITVNPLVTPTFNAIPAFCAGTTAPVLPTTSLNGIVGTWSPATVSNTTSGTYTFTPNAGQCVTSTPVQITITVNPLVTPAFDPIPSFCAGTTAPVLPTTSLNGIVGTWLPANVSNTTSSTYTFTPNAGQCVTSTPVQITITVNPSVTPAFDPIPAFCAGTTAPVLTSTSLNGIVGTWSPATVSNTTSGTYTFTPTAGQCVTSTPVQLVTTINPSNLTDFQWIVSEPFSSNPTITIIPNSPGNYLYQLDSGTPQTSNVFYNVSSGLHTVQVTDINGCSDTIVKNDILIIDYPRFFTPNGDGYNDTWNINDLYLQKNSKIYIYDRYGKLLKQIFPFQSGWDGKYNNNDMFSDDYWFVVEFEYNNTMKLFKSHFTLKR